MLQARVWPAAGGGKWEAVRSGRAHLHDMNIMERAGSLADLATRALPVERRVQTRADLRDIFGARPTGSSLGPLHSGLRGFEASVLIRMGVIRTVIVLSRRWRVR